MEEILSSIRRIIADEEAPDREDAELGAAEAETSGEDDADATGSETDTDDVLELTRVVRESGEVVDLNFAAAQRDERIEEPEPEGPDAEVVGPDAEETLERSDDPAEAALGAAPDPFQAAQARDHAPQPSISSIQDRGMDHGAAMQTNDKGIDSLVSDHAAGMATGAFAKLSQAVQRTPPEVAIADDSGRTVEQFVEDMIRPMLREWLDQHMPPLVERIVQKEIQKIVRRAELD